jgi:hypothetical protein
MFAEMTTVYCGNHTLHINANYWGVNEGHTAQCSVKGAIERLLNFREETSISGYNIKMLRNSTCTLDAMYRRARNFRSPGRHWRPNILVWR